MTDIETKLNNEHEKLTDLMSQRDRVNDLIADMGQVRREASLMLDGEAHRLLATIDKAQSALTGVMAIMQRNLAELEYAIEIVEGRIEWLEGKAGAA